MSNLLRFVEAVYRPERSSCEWMDGLLRAAHAMHARSSGACAWSATWDEKSASLRRLVTTGPDAARLRHALVTLARAPRALLHCHRRPVDTLHGRLETWGDGLPVWSRPEQGDFSMLMITALDSRGAALGLGIARPGTDGGGDGGILWQRVADHLASGLRLWGDELIQPPEHGVESGHQSEASALVDDAVGAREQRRRDAVAIDATHGADLLVEASLARSTWIELLEGRGALVDQFHSNGRKYLLVRRGREPVAGANPLTERQRQVLVLRSAGRPLKVVASELGVSVSTVACDLARALRQLGLRSASDLPDLASEVPRQGVW